MPDRDGCVPCSQAPDLRDSRAFRTRDEVFITAATRTPTDAIECWAAHLRGSSGKLLAHRAAAGYPTDTGRQSTVWWCGRITGCSGTRSDFAVRVFSGSRTQNEVRSPFSRIFAGRCHTWGPVVDDRVKAAGVSWNWTIRPGHRRHGRRELNHAGHPAPERVPIRNPTAMHDVAPDPRASVRGHHKW